ncbi:MAG TPA: histidine kinase dimerization/phospho-acceptor domain-containing protein [Negativicutes bacterium]|nr:histidine kinase dimerization/phospho-acceptor domain-containing protein [Negativicutes bacterium]
MEKVNKKNPAHTLNNLLAGISLSAQVLLQEIDGPLNARQKKYLKDILASVKKMKGEIKQLP